MTQAQALVLTWLIELPALAACHRLARARAPLTRCLLLGAAASLLTHPVAWSANQHLAWRLTADQALQGWLLIEGAVVLAEAALFRLGLRWPWRLSLAVSLACNAMSATAGLLLGSRAHAA